MKHWILLIVLVLLVSASAQAQESTCDADLLDEIATLVDAQSAASGGDVEGATAMIAEVQAQLDELLASCAQADSLLPQTFQSADGLLRVNYPAEWTMQSAVGGAYVFSNDPAALTAILESNFGDPIPDGSQALVLTYGNIQSFFPVETFDELITLVEDVVLSNEAQFTNPEAISLQDFPGYQYDFGSDELDGTAYVLDLSARRAQHMLMLISMTPAGEYSDFEPLFEAIVASMEYGPDSTASAVEPPSGLILNTGVALSDITYGEAISVRSLTGTVDGNEVEVDPRTAVISPDGTRIAWYERAGVVCEITLATNAVACVPLPNDFRGTPEYVLWSPDSRYVAFTQEWARTLREPDLWVYDVTTQTVNNLTDDDISRLNFGSEPREGESAGPLWVEMAYTWGPDGNLYFVRVDAPDATDLDVSSTGLYRLAPTGGEPTLIRDLGGIVSQFSIYQIGAMDLQGAVVISPDATQIAFLVRGIDRDDPNTGVWVMPLSADGEALQILTPGDFTLGLPSDLDPGIESLMLSGLGWAPDQSSLLIYLSSPIRAQEVPSMIYHYNFADGSLTPFQDFSAYTTDTIQDVDPDTGRAPIADAPRAITLSPDGSTPIIIQFDNDLETLRLTSLPLDGESQILLEIPRDLFSPVASTSVAADGTVLMFGVLFRPES
jgi:hypothetical protein